LSRLSSLSLALLTAGLLALAGCGGGSSSQSESATQILRDTFGPNHPIHSGKLTLAVGLQAQGVPSLKGPVSIRLSGPFQSRGKGKVPLFDFTFDLSSAGQSFSAGAVSTGTKAFLTFGGNAYSLPDNLFASFEQSFAQAQSTAAKRPSRSTLSALGIDPLRWLQNPSKAGTQDVGGSRTIHTRADVNIVQLLQDVSKLLSRFGQTGAAGTARIPRTITPLQQQEIQRSIKTASLDVYTGSDDKTLRRLTIDLVLSVPADLRTKASSLTSGNLSFDLQFSDLNHSQSVSAPRNPQPLTNLTSAIPGLGGALGGTAGGSSGASPGAGAGGAAGGTSGAGGGGTSGAGGGASPPGAGGAAGGTSGAGGAAGAGNSSAYLQCLQRAGQNIAAVQKCASLLGH
jgi:hypothetical protein